MFCLWQKVAHFKALMAKQKVSLPNVKLVSMHWICVFESVSICNFDFVRIMKYMFWGVVRIICFGSCWYVQVWVFFQFLSRMLCMSFRIGECTYF